MVSLPAVTDARELTDAGRAVPDVEGERVIDLPALERRERAATRRQQQAVAREARKLARLRTAGIVCVALGIILGVIGLVATLLG